MFSNIRKIYKYSRSDALKSLFSVLSEIVCFPFFKPTVKELSLDIGNFTFLKIKNFEFYFPKAFSDKQLPKIYWEIFVERIYEHKNCKINANEWVVDVGACEGFFTFYALRKGANVLMFEPEVHLFEALEKTFEDYVQNNRVLAFNLALGDKNSKSVLVLNDTNVGGSFILRDKDHLNFSNKKVSEISVVTLDELYLSGKIPQVSFIKADIEGFERYMLKGATTVLKDLRPKLAICYYHRKDDFDVIMKFLEDLNVGYKFSFNHQVIFAYTKEA